MIGAAVRAGAGIALAGCAVALGNRLGVRRLSGAAAAVIEPITVCVPARDEATRLPGLIADLRAQVGVARMRVLILDDGSTDGTSDAAVAAIGDDVRFTVIRAGGEPPPGWTGKAAACARLAAAADTSVLIFLDADVRLAPGAVASAAGALRRSGAALISPWPRQEFGSFSEALAQPLLCWSWASTLPIALANRSLRPSTAVACGQFLVFDGSAYRSVGGHAVVAGSPTEDLDIARALRRSGLRTELVAAGRLARTRMYRGAAEVDDGYTRWLWSAYGGTAFGGIAVGFVAALAYWTPPLAMLFGRGSVRRAGTVGYAAAVTSRILARTTESAAAPTRADVLAALAHPLSIAAYLRLWIRSRQARRQGRLRWKGRQLPS